MISYMVYESKDGKLFNTAEECLAHEYYRDHLPPSVKWYTKDWKPIVPGSYEQIDSQYNDVGIVELLDTPTWQEDLRYMLEEFGYGETEWIPGIYYYIGDMDYQEVVDWRWTHPDRKIYGWDEWTKLEEGEVSPFD